MTRTDSRKGYPACYTAEEVRQLAVYLRLNAHISRSESDRIASSRVVQKRVQLLLEQYQRGEQMDRVLIVVSLLYNGKVIVHDIEGTEEEIQQVLVSHQCILVLRLNELLTQVFEDTGRLIAQAACGAEHHGTLQT